VLVIQSIYTCRGDAIVHVNPVKIKIWQTHPTHYLLSIHSITTMEEKKERRGSRIEATGYSSDPKHPTSTTIPGGAHKGLGVKVAEFLGLDTDDSYREVKGDGPSTAEPLPVEGEMGTGHVHKAADTTAMEGPGGGRVSIAGPAADEDVGAMGGAGAEHQYANETAGESRFNIIPGASSTSQAQCGTGQDAGTIHDATTTGLLTGHNHHGGEA
jgi:hypothetical protein